MYASVPFLKALKQAPTHLKFLRELFSKKKESREASLAPNGEAYNAILSNKSPSKL